MVLGCKNIWCLYIGSYEFSRIYSLSTKFKWREANSFVSPFVYCLLPSVAFCDPQVYRSFLWNYTTEAHSVLFPPSNMVCLKSEAQISILGRNSLEKKLYDLFSVSFFYSFFLSFCYRLFGFRLYGFLIWYQSSNAC